MSATARLAGLMLLLAAAPASAETLPLRLTGQLTQGGLVIGRTAPGARVLLVIDRKFWWEKARKRVREDIPVDPDGQFVFGFGREAPPTAVLRISLSGRPSRTETLTVRPRRFRVQRINGVARKFVTPPAHLKARLKREFLMIVEARKTFSDRRGYLQPFLQPVKGRVSGVYGSQRVYNGKPRSPHFGLDLAAPRGTPVRAPADGIVLLTHHLFFAGKTVMLDHGRGVTSTYIHLSRIRVTKGQEIRRGEIVGEVGTTGRSTGPHLHWGLNWRQIRLDPALRLWGRPARYQPRRPSPKTR